MSNLDYGTICIKCALMPNPYIPKMRILLSAKFSNKWQFMAKSLGSKNRLLFFFEPSFFEKNVIPLRKQHVSPYAGVLFESFCWISRKLPIFIRTFLTNNFASILGRKITFWVQNKRCSKKMRFFRVKSFDYLKIKQKDFKFLLNITRANVKYCAIPILSKKLGSISRKNYFTKCAFLHYFFKYSEKVKNNTFFVSLIRGYFLFS